MRLFSKKNSQIRIELCILILCMTAVSFIYDSVDGNTAVIAQAETGQKDLDDLDTTVPLAQECSAFSVNSVVPELPVVPTGALILKGQTDPAVPEQLSAAAAPKDQTGPTALSLSKQPTAPTAAAAPEDQIEPTAPSLPKQPTAPTAATAPEDQTEPTAPSLPKQPTAPTVSTVPEQPAVPAVSFRASVSLKKNGKNAFVSWKKLKGVSSYSIYRSSKKDGSYKKVAVCSAGSSKYTDKNVKRGNHYYYRVTAAMENGKKVDSKKLKFACPLHTVSGVKLIRYSTSSVKVVWNQNKQAGCYKVYYAANKTGKKDLAGTTTDTYYRVKNLKKDQKYYFSVKACNVKKTSELDSALSKAAAMTMREYERTTVFAGDSITTGLTSYGILDDMHIGGNKNVVAAVGLNTITFRTRREFGGLSALGRIIASKPYRVYIMLGTNEIHYRSYSEVIAGYREIVLLLQNDASDTDIVLLAVPPVTRSTQQRSSGFAQIPVLNQKIKAMAAELGVKYYDPTQVLKDADGYLNSQYAAGDGIHWTQAAYRLFAAQIEKYDGSLD